MMPAAKESAVARHSASLRQGEKPHQRDDRADDTGGRGEERAGDESGDAIDPGRFFAAMFEGREQAAHDVRAARTM